MESIATRIADKIRENRKALVESEIVIFGCTSFSKQIFNVLKRYDMPVGAIVDNDSTKWQKKFLGIPVYNPEKYLLPTKKDRIIIICSVHHDAMKKQLFDFGYGDDNVIEISVEVELEELDTRDVLNTKMTQVRMGLAVYEQLQYEYGKETTFIIAPRASGDIYIALGFIEIWKEYRNINSYILVGERSNLDDIAELFGLQDKCRHMGRGQLNPLRTAHEFLHDKINVKIISEWTNRTRISYFPRQETSFCFCDKFRIETFGLTKDTDPCFPKSSGFSQEKYCFIKKGKTIILAPYAYSSPAAIVPETVWKKIVIELNELGWEVFTLGYGPDELPIEGTERIQFDYSEATALLEYAGGLIASRSGLSDIVHAADCHHVVVYGRSIRNPQGIDFFSMKRNYPAFRGDEIVFDDYEENDFIDTVIDCFSR